MLSRTTDIIEVTASLLDIPKDVLIGESRKHALIRGRQVCAVVMRERGATLEVIAQALKRDNSTVVNILKAGQRQMQLSPYFVRRVEEVRENTDIREAQRAQRERLFSAKV